jgi:hypothetical protein
MALMSTRTDVSAATEIPKIVQLSIALVSGVGLVTVALFMCVAPMVGKVAGARDFVFYWATGQQLIHHSNPYDAIAMTPIERAAGLPAMYSVGFMRNPPYALPLALPLGLVSLRVGTLLWSLALLASLAGSVQMLWQLYGRPRNSLHWLAYSFGPAIICLIAGQTAMLALLGLVLFLRLHQSRPFLAGASLWLCALKPHLFLVFGVVLLAWIVVERSYKILAGAAVTLAASFAVTYFIDPRAWSEYSQMMRTGGIEKETIPCLGIALRLWLSPQSLWLQFLPAMLGCVWALSYFWPRRHTWDWLRNGSAVMLVSIVVTPFGWLFDQVVAIPALLDGVYLTRSSIMLVILAVASGLVQIDSVFGVGFFSGVILFTAPAWLAWYLIVCALAKRSKSGKQVWL